MIKKSIYDLPKSKEESTKWIISKSELIAAIQSEKGGLSDNAICVTSEDEIDFLISWISANRKRHGGYIVYSVGWFDDDGEVFSFCWDDMNITIGVATKGIKFRQKQKLLKLMNYSQQDVFL